MQNYHDLLKLILEKGEDKSDRTGTGTRSIFGHQMRFDLNEGFPLLTTKKIHWKSVAIELLWFLSGDTNIRYLRDNGVTIWDEWADANGDLGPVYGEQWRKWKGNWSPSVINEMMVVPAGYYKQIDQIYNVIDSIRNSPDSRRHIVTAWNPAVVDEMYLPPCHCLFQFYVSNGKLSCQLYQRSVDTFLGLPFNIASYALLTHMIAQQCDLEVGDFVWTGGDIHIYNNHMDAVNEILTRAPKELPKLVINRKPSSIDGYVFEDFTIENYDSYPTIKAPIAV